MPEQVILSHDNPWNYRCPLPNCSGQLWESETNNPKEKIYYCDCCGKSFLWCEVD